MTRPTSNDELFLQPLPVTGTNYRLPRIHVMFFVLVLYSRLNTHFNRSSRLYDVPMKLFFYNYQTILSVLLLISIY